MGFGPVFKNHPIISSQLKTMDSFSSVLTRMARAKSTFKKWIEKIEEL
jgi:hypothetical protein